MIYTDYTNISTILYHFRPQYIFGKNIQKFISLKTSNSDSNNKNVLGGAFINFHVAQQDLNLYNIFFFRTGDHQPLLQIQIIQSGW